MTMKDQAWLARRSAALEICETAMEIVSFRLGMIPRVCAAIAALKLAIKYHGHGEDIRAEMTNHIRQTATAVTVCRNEMGKPAPLLIGGVLAIANANVDIDVRKVGAACWDRRYMEVARLGMSEAKWNAICEGICFKNGV
jgi:hypothetical protein